MLDDRDHRPEGTLSGWRSQSVGQEGPTNAQLAAALRELDRERPERLAALLGVMMVSIVATGAALLALAVLR